MAKKYLLISLLMLGTITPLTHDKLDGVDSNEHIDWTDATDNFKTSGTFHLTTSKTPTSATDTGTTGQVGWDSSYIYVCVESNSWRRATLSAWGITDVLLLDDGVSKLLLDDGVSNILIRP